MQFASDAPLANYITLLVVLAGCRLVQLALHAVILRSIVGNTVICRTTGIYSPGVIRMTHTQIASCVRYCETSG